MAAESGQAADALKNAENGVKLHFVGFHKLAQFLNVEWG